MAEIKFIETDSKNIYDFVINKLEEGCSEELYPGDERRIFGEALVPLVVAIFHTVNDSCKQKMLRYARGEVLDALGETKGVLREKATPAITTMRFSVNNAMDRNIVIPEGTRVTGDYINYFATDSVAVITAGETYVDIPATCQTLGSSGNNMKIGAINILVDMVPYVDLVTNLEATRMGFNEEKDDAYRDRIRIGNTMSVAGPPNAYRYWAMTASDEIADAYVYSPTPGVVEIVPVLYNGEIPSQDILDKVLEICSRSDIRPLTDKVQTAAPEIEEYDIEIVYFTTPDKESDCIQTIEGENGAISRYIEWQGSSLNRDLNPDYLRKLILAPDWDENLTGAVMVNVIKPEFKDLPKNCIGKFSGKLNVTHKLTTSE